MSADVVTDTTSLAVNSLINAGMKVVPGVDEVSVAGLMNMTGTFMKSTTTSLFMIIVTELGDKTFFIAAILAMRNGRLVVYAGAMAALGIMHILSSLMGYALPSILPRTYTHIASAILFLYFGFRLLKDAYDMDGSGPSDELQEVEEELRKTKGDGKGEEADDRRSSGDHDEEEGKLLSSSGGGNHHEKVKLAAVAAEKLKVFTQAFTLTFLAEWGDRSQIATIAMAAAKNPFGVIFGGLIGHALCTGLAVIGGRMLASRISERTVAILGGILFLFFGIESFILGPDVM